MTAFTKHSGCVRHSAQALLLLLPVMGTSRGSLQARQRHHCFFYHSYHSSSPTAPTEAHLPHIY